MTWPHPPVCNRRSFFFTCWILNALPNTHTHTYTTHTYTTHSLVHVHGNLIYLGIYSAVQQIKSSCIHLPSRYWFCWYRLWLICACLTTAWLVVGTKKNTLFTLHTSCYSGTHQIHLLLHIHTLSLYPPHTHTHTYTTFSAHTHTSPLAHTTHIIHTRTHTYWKCLLCVKSLSTAPTL